MIGWIHLGDLSFDDREVCAEHGDECNDHFVCVGCGEVTHVVAISGSVRRHIYGTPPRCARCRAGLRAYRRRNREQRHAA